MHTNKTTMSKCRFLIDVMCIVLHYYGFIHKIHILILLNAAIGKLVYIVYWSIKIIHCQLRHLFFLIKEFSIKCRYFENLKTLKKRLKMTSHTASDLC